MRKFLAVAMFLFLGVASPRSDIAFDDVTDETNLKYQSGDAFEVFQSTWIDINDDGFLDLWVGNHAYGFRNNPMLYINEKGQAFRNAFDDYFPNLYRSDNHGTNWGDFDNDGDLDMYNNCGGASGSGEVTARALYVNQNGTMIESAETAGLTPLLGSGRYALWVDYNSDGLSDLFSFAENISGTGEGPSMLYRQKEGGVFEKVNEELGLSLEEDILYGLVSDLWGNGKPDIIGIDGTGNTHGFIYRVYEMDNGTISDVSSRLGVFKGRHKDAAIADFNNDLVADILIFGGNIMYRDSAVWSNIDFDRYSWIPSQPLFLVYDHETGECVDKTVEAGFTEELVARAVVSGDFDNDGDLDVYVLQHAAHAFGPEILYENDGSGKFTKVADAGGATHVVMGPAGGKDFSIGPSLAVGDYDNDGRLDIYTSVEGTWEKGNPEADFQVGVDAALFRNVSENDNSWIELNCIGTVSTRDAIGTKVVLYSGNKSQMREKNGGHHKSGTDMQRLHFGLGNASGVDSIVVYWPSGTVDVHTDLDPNQILTITEGDPQVSAHLPRGTSHSPCLQNSGRRDAVYDLRGRIIQESTLGTGRKSTIKSGVFIVQKGGRIIKQPTLRH